VPDAAPNTQHPTPSTLTVMTSQAVTVVNQLGMHARAAAKFVHLATRFQAHVRVARDRREMDGKSIMGILLLAAARGSTITISAEGSDEQEAVTALVDLVQSGFGEGACA
jgi:phosphotransferase system HPr (HPr) family protein